MGVPEEEEREKETENIWRYSDPKVPKFDEEHWFTHSNQIQGGTHKHS